MQGNPYYSMYGEFGIIKRTTIETETEPEHERRLGVQRQRTRLAREGERKSEHERRLDAQRRRDTSSLPSTLRVPTSIGWK